MKELAIVVGLVAVGILGVMFPQTAVYQNLGSGSGQTQYNSQFNRGLVQGGVYNVATSASAMTLRNADIQNVAVISINQSSTTATFDPALALTLPASSTWTGLEANGDSQTWIIDNNQTAAGTTTTLTAGAGVDIDGTTANDDVLNGGVSGVLTCWRLPTTNIRCIAEEMVDAG